LRAHPVLSPKLKEALGSLGEWYTIKDVINLSNSGVAKELKKYLEAIQDPKKYNDYFINQIKENRKRGVINVSWKVWQWKFGVPLLDDQNLADWANALDETWTTSDGLSSLENISRQLARVMWLQVTPEELKRSIAGWAIRERNWSEMVWNYNVNWKQVELGDAKKLTTWRYVTFNVKKTYTVITSDWKEIKVTEDVAVDLKADCANLNIDRDSAMYTIKWLGFDESRSRIETWAWTLPLLGVSVLGFIWGWSSGSDGPLGGGTGSTTWWGGASSGLGEWGWILIP
jgi:hypothetical protein